MDRLTGCFGRAEIALFQPPENSCIVSITDPNTNDAKCGPDGVQWSGILKLKFWDVVREYHHLAYTPARPEQIESIWEFIEVNRDRHIFAHCEAGVSRSAAVREYLIRRGWTLLDAAQKRRPVFPNMHVLTSLQRHD